MSVRPRIDIEITADSGDARKDIDDAGDSMSKFKDKAGKVGAVAAGVAGGLVAIGLASVDAAADMERAKTTVGRVFGEAAGAVEDYADRSAESVGISKEAYLSASASIGNSLRGMGLSVDEAAAKNDELLVTAGDMALALGIEVPDATAALSAALRGEFDSLSEFGVAVDDTTVKAGLAAQGISGPEGMDQAAYDAAYQQELLNQVLGGAGEIYGGYRSETDTTAESTDKLAAQFDNARAMLGEQLLPVLQFGTEKLSDFLTWIDKNKETIKQWLPWLAAGAAAVWVLNWAMAANPFVLAALALAALIAVCIIFEDEISEVVGKVDEFIKAFEDIIPGLGPVRTFLRFMKGDVEGITSAINFAIGAVDALISAWNKLTTTTVAGIPSMPTGRAVGSGLIVPMSMSTAPAVAGRGLMAASASSDVPAFATALGAFGAGVTIINVTGAIDPDSTARQIDRLLRSRERRVGPVSV